MSQRKHPVVITALKSKAHLVREAALRLDITFTESPVPEQEGLLRFHFDSLDEATTARLATVLPTDVYAYSGRLVA